MADSFQTDAGACDLGNLVTDVDLSAYQYCPVKRDATDGKIVPCGANDKALGVLQNAPVGSATKDEIAIVRIKGVSLVKVSETVTFGKYLTPTSGSLGEVCDAAGEDFFARVIDKEGGANDYVSCDIIFGEVEASDA